MNAKVFEKTPLTIAEQIRLLQSRGLLISNEQLARHYLQFISYYRFCGYGLEFEEISNKERIHRYNNGTTFEKVLDCYIFDRKLRLLVIDAIEQIEVAVRTVITNELALKYGSHWYTKKELFLPKYNYAELINAIQKETSYSAMVGTVKHKKRERFIQHYFDNYSEPKLPPIWMVAEVLSLGTWSILFANLINRDDQKLICKPFGLNYVVVTSWLHSLTYLRNLCAHHSMLWNREFTFKPLIAKQYAQQLADNTKFSAQAVIIKVLLNVIAPNNHWSYHLYDLIKAHSNINLSKMGFSVEWHNDPFWNISQ